MASNWAIGTIVERHSGYLTLLHLPQGMGRRAGRSGGRHDPDEPVPPWFAKTLTWDRGGRDVPAPEDHPADRHPGATSPNPTALATTPATRTPTGPLREYFPKSTDLTVHDAACLQEVAEQLNHRPRKRLGYLTPREAFDNLIAKDLKRVATAP